MRLFLYFWEYYNHNMKKKDTRILLVDDEPDIIEILTYNLSNEGYQIETLVR